MIAPQEVRVQRIMAREERSEEYAWSGSRPRRATTSLHEGCDYTLYNDCAQAEEFALRAKTLVESILQEHVQ